MPQHMYYTVHFKKSFMRKNSDSTGTYLFSKNLQIVENKTSVKYV